MEGERSLQSQESLKLDLAHSIKLQDLGIILGSLWLYLLGSRLYPKSFFFFIKGSKCWQLSVLSACFLPLVFEREGGVVHSYYLLLFGTSCPFWSKLVMSLLYKVLKNLVSVLHMSLRFLSLARGLSIDLS